MKKTNLSEYEKQAINFLKKANAKISISFVEVVQGFPNDTKDHYLRNKYSVKIRRGSKTYTFPFYDSHNNYIKNERPTAYDILACLEKYPVYGDLWDFANEYGYEITSRDEYNTVNKIYKACSTQYTKLLNLFGDELMEDLQEIC